MKFRLPKFARRRETAVVMALTALAPLAGCAATPRYGRPGAPLPRLGDEIVVCGQLMHTGAPVVLWLDPGGYDAYRAECRFSAATMPSNPVSPAPVRYSTLRRELPPEVEERVRQDGWSLPLLQQCVDHFVLHYDACGTSRRCFEVLQDRRGLSVHFMLDLDGTIYQTLDLKERAWHAGTDNDRSVGVEIANIGAYEYKELATLRRWYAPDETGRLRVTLPADFGPGGLRTAGFVARPARDSLIGGTVNGRALQQHDFTAAQYDSLIKLTATLCRVLPRIRPDYPRDAAGNLRAGKLTDDELQHFSGVLGHFHVTMDKVDPGPAFDWERLRTGVVRQLRR